MQYFILKKERKKERKKESPTHPPPSPPLESTFQFSETNQQITLLKRLQISPFHDHAHEIPTTKQNRNHFSVNDHGSFYLNGP